MNKVKEQPPFPDVLPLTISDAKVLAPSLLKDNEDLRLAVVAINSQDALGVLVLMSTLRDRIEQLRNQPHD